MPSTIIPLPSEIENVVLGAPIDKMPPLIRPVDNACLKWSPILGLNVSLAPTLALSRNIPLPAVSTSLSSRYPAVVSAALIFTESELAVAGNKDGSRVPAPSRTIGLPASGAPELVLTCSAAEYPSTSLFSPSVSFEINFVITLVPLNQCGLF